MGIVYKGLTWKHTADQTEPDAFQRIHPLSSYSFTEPISLPAQYEVSTVVHVELATVDTHPEPEKNFDDLMDEVSDSLAGDILTGLNPSSNMEVDGLINSISIHTDGEYYQQNQASHYQVNLTLRINLL